MKKFLAKLMGVGSSVWSFYAPVLRDLFAAGSSALLPLALEIVRSLASSPESSGQKRENAVSALQAASVRLGLTASESLIRFTVESAVQKMRAQ